MSLLAQEIEFALQDLSQQQGGDAAGGINFLFPQPVIDAANALATAYQEITTNPPPISAFPVSAMPTSNPGAGPDADHITSADSHVYNAWIIASRSGYSQVKEKLIEAHRALEVMGSNATQWSQGSFGEDSWTDEAMAQAKTAYKNPFAYIGAGVGAFFGPLGILIGAAVGTAAGNYIRR
jgi:hypothetical protein